MNDNIIKVIPLCEEHSNQLIKNFQEFWSSFKEEKDIFSNFIKVAGNGSVYLKSFVEENNMREHMWFSVVSIDVDKNEFTGVLDNDPIECLSYKCGNTYTLDFSRVSDLKVYKD